ncbi:MAG: inositol monophosphatase [Devosia sp.]|uniref:inositol monophosphatase family protein n=1 Tax=Devosia sp. TaxID=1871048 RepID=UPI003390B98D
MTNYARERADRLAAGKTIILQAGAIALDYFKRYQALDVHSKGIGDLFSEADTSVESFIRTAIAEQFPQDGQLGEEHGASAGDSVYQWIIDPIDGTSCFLFGLPTWCVVIALLEDGVPVVGLTYDACQDQLYWASLGQGAYRNGSKITVHTSAAIAGGLTAIGGSNSLYSVRVGAIIERLLAANGSYMRNGSTALTLAHVAAGHYIGYFQPLLNAWDCLAGLVLVAEAGGVTNDFMVETGLNAQGDVFAAAPQVAAELAGIVGRVS